MHSVITEVITIKRVLAYPETSYLIRYCVFNRFVYYVGHFRSLITLSCDNRILRLRKH